MKFTKMEQMQANWDGEGAEAPNQVAIDNTKRIIGLLLESIGEPMSILPSVENGIMIYYKQNNLSVYVECYNDGEIGYTFVQNGKPGESRDMKAENMSEEDFIKDIQRYLKR